MPEEINVLSANLWGLPWPVSKDLAARFERFSAFVEQGCFDIVGLQEVWRNARRRLRIDGVRLPDLRTGDSGLALAGPLARAAPLRIEHYRASRRLERFKQKGYLMAEVALADLGPLTVVVTHLQAGRSHAAARLAQVEQLVTAVRAQDAVLLMGDFNFHADQPADLEASARLLAAGFIDVAETLGPPAPTYHFDNPYVVEAQGHQRLDRMYIRARSAVSMAPLEFEVLSRPTFSDHHAIRCRLRVERR